MSSIYWVAGAAIGLAEGTAYAVEQLCPCGSKLTKLVGFHSAPKKRDSDQSARPAAGNAPAAAGAPPRDSWTDDTAAGASGADAPGARALRHLSSFPVDDLAPFASGNSLSDAAAGTGGEAGAGVPPRVPRLKLPAPSGGGRADIASGTDVAPPLPGPAASASRLTAQNIGPFNAAYEIARSRMGGGAGETELDALTIATVNRYTYGLGEMGLASARSSQPGTPRSGAASDSAMAAHRKQQGLFRGLRRKGQKANQQLR
ncbi:hypothetical protein Rsub_00138 [Raphidocelis subcapitata]|uniref:Uncharacterized protein n=1 Tax=Raphidocelis subcapitata TaxID=307507 RepID=A0A2V0NR73_9CHLO|nr:hypothetical protein Rsub_00138 [Raphidocelis subcapitata]|eukprot:GBF87427.1 hypothetical protein Rsub_00138 [Raphidocelis subcapitata]